MEDEEKKRRYRNIAYRLSIVESKISALSDSINSLERTMGNTILLNDKIYKGDDISSIKKSLSSAKVTIANNRYSVSRKGY